jgi:hypothetical protein
MKRVGHLALFSLIAVSLSGCAVFDNEARDKEACDRLSSLLTGNGEGSLTENATADLMTQIEQEVLPLASGQFGMEIRQLIDSYGNLEEQSIFDQLAGTSDTFYYAGQILDYCVSLSSNR